MCTAPPSSPEIILIWRGSEEQPWFGRSHGSDRDSVLWLLMGISYRPRARKLRTPILHQLLIIAAKSSIYLGKLFLLPSRCHHRTPQTNQQKQPREVRPADCRDGYNYPTISRKMSSRFLIIGGKGVLIDLKRSRDVSVSVGLSHVPDARCCDASVPPLSPVAHDRIRQDTALGQHVQVITEKWFIIGVGQETKT